MIDATTVGWCFVVGSPEFAVGEEVVVFLRGAPPKMPVLFGLSQGVYRVSRASGVPMVLPVLPTDGLTSTPRGDSLRRPLALAEFARQVRQAAGMTP